MPDVAGLSLPGRGKASWPTARLARPARAVGRGQAAMQATARAG
jgi:hypothetical protein